MPFLMGEVFEVIVRWDGVLNLKLHCRVDLDIEGGTSLGYAAFVNQIRSHASGASKKSDTPVSIQTCVFDGLVH